MEEQLGAILGNPEMMAKIQALAGSLGAPQETQAVPDFDADTAKGIASALSKASIDTRQQKLLDALAGYLPPHRIEKLRKAMRAAKLADVAGAFLKGRGGNV